ncbi:MAG: aspartate carbamoyltransferase catalytic subunit [Deferribacteraceae bacterium]|jgi:aspartate carbamoyltransferase catalytic subunit|nr:aspartate carbamoyltransferase catalytic subunit [Deferribacteraceae bacterium]
MGFEGKDFISTQNLKKDDILSILDTAEEFFTLNKGAVKKTDLLRGRTVVNLFFENSTRTRTSFEIAAKRLGADTINFNAAISSTQKGETLIDTVHNLEAMHTDIFVMRHEYSGSVKFVAENSGACVVNAGDGLNEHPSQAMLDLFTIRKAKGRLEGLNVTIIGDISHSRVARSNIWAMHTMGMNVKLFAPPTVIPNDVSAFGCEVCSDINEAVNGADVVITLRIQRERQGKLLIPSTREYSALFGVTPAVMKYAKSDMMILHPGPVNRGVELSSYTADSENSAILDQVESGVAIRMAILSMVKG